MTTFGIKMQTFEALIVFVLLLILFLLMWWADRERENEPKRGALEEGDICPECERGRLWLPFPPGSGEDILACQMCGFEVRPGGDA